MDIPYWVTALIGAVVGALIVNWIIARGEQRDKWPGK